MQALSGGGEGAYCTGSCRTLVLLNFPLGTLPSGCSHRACLLSGPPFLPHCLFPKFRLCAYLPKSVHETSLFLQFCRRFFCVIFPFPKGTHVGVSIVASTSALASVTQALRKLASTLEGKREEILVEIGRQSLLQIPFYWERFHCCKLNLNWNWFNSALLGVKWIFLSRLTVQPYLQHFFREGSFQSQTTLEMHFSNSFQPSISPPDIIDMKQSALQNTCGL